MPKVQLLLTGNELMTGDILDSNSAMIAQDLGLEIYRKVTVADDINLLTTEINHIAKHADILIINGGLGPTIDDLTAQALAQAMQVSLIQNQEALAQLMAWCDSRGVKLNKPNLKQTMLPKGCSIITNRKGSAVGFHVAHFNCDIYCTPGVPHELKTMLAEQIKPAIAKKWRNNQMTNVTRLQVFGLGESNLQNMIDEKFPDWPQNIDLGFRAGLPLLEIKLSCKNETGLKQKPIWEKKLINLLEDHFIDQITEKPKTLAEHVLIKLQQYNLKITTAESCTGGLIASMLTSVSGSSKCFEAGFVTYSNDTKSSLIAVPKQTIKQYGAVSKEVVMAMALGAIEKSGANLAIAVSGIAGPNGGSVEKPVGTVWLAWGSKKHLQTQCLLLPFKRHYFQKYVAAIALDLIRRVLIKSNKRPNYINERSFAPEKTTKQV